MNLKEIKEIVNLMNENDLAEIEIEREGSKVKIKKSAQDFVPLPPSRPSLEYRIEAHPPVAAAESTAAAAASTNKNAQVIPSPMVGTFYRAPSPEAPPFVEIGQVVEVGQVVCIVEAMKLMNEIKSEIRGKVVEIAVENSEPVEFGQALFVLDPIK